MQMKIKPATRQYELWLGSRIPLVRADLVLKHAFMTRDVFSFLRATFYRWAQVWPQVCTDLALAPVVLAVGDLHVANFGTWRDREGRLIWGINDFDEAYPLPYTNDLVRLAVSAVLAINAQHLTIRPKTAYDAILTGYMDGLKSKGRDPIRFWHTMQALPLVKGSIPARARAALEQLMPEPGLSYRLRRRVAGMGSLGRPRYVALGMWQGDNIAREAKALAPSACVWVNEGRGPNTIMYQSIVDQAVRSRDPFVQVLDNWIVRRLAPYCSRIELALLPKKRNEGRLLYAMGWETANIHLGSRRAIKAVHHDMSKRKANWLRIATKSMMKVTTSDWTEWGDSISRKARTRQGVQ